MSEAIERISTGMDGTTGDFLLASSQSEYVIEHGLGRIPSAFVIFTNKDYQTMSGNYRLIAAIACATSNVQYRFTYSKGVGSLGAYMENSKVWTGETRKNMINYMTEQSVTVCPADGSYQLIANTPYTWIALGEN